MDWPEITTVETVFGIRVHKENLVGSDAVAALPDRHRATTTVSVLRFSHTDPVDGDVATEPADDLSRQPGHMFEKWGIWWQIAPFGNERGNGVGRSHSNEIARTKIIDRLQAIEADGDRGTGVPE